MSRGRWYLTRYAAEPGRRARPFSKAKHADERSWVSFYSSYIWATSWTNAERKARLRGIGEIVEGESCRRGNPERRPSELLAKRRLTLRDRLAIIHGATFVTFLLMNCRRSRTMLDRSKMLVGDQGLLHQLVHCLSFGRPRRRKMIAMLDSFERKIPGFVRT
jgi:hypothetical protein